MSSQLSSVRRDLLMKEQNGLRSTAMSTTDRLVERVLSSLVSIDTELDMKQMSAFVDKMIDEFDDQFDALSLEEKGKLMTACKCKVDRLSMSQLAKYSRLYKFELKWYATSRSSDESELSDDQNSDNCDERCFKCTQTIRCCVKKLKVDYARDNNKLKQSDNDFCNRLWDNDSDDNTETDYDNNYTDSESSQSNSTQTFPYDSKTSNKNQSKSLKRRKRVDPWDRKSKKSKKLTPKNVVPSSKASKSNTEDVNKGKFKGKGKGKGKGKSVNVKSNKSIPPPVTNFYTPKTKNVIFSSAKNDTNKTKRPVGRPATVTQKSKSLFSDKDAKSSRTFSEDNSDDSDVEYTKFLGGKFKTSDLLAQCNVCNPKCEVDELTLAFNILMSCSEENLPKDLRKNYSGDSDSSDSDKSKVIQGNKEDNCGELNNLMGCLPQVEDIYAAERDNLWEDNDLLDAGINEFFKKTGTL